MAASWEVDAQRACTESPSWGLPSSAEAVLEADLARPMSPTELLISSGALDAGAIAAAGLEDADLAISDFDLKPWMQPLPPPGEKLWAPADAMPKDAARAPAFSPRLLMHLEAKDGKQLVMQLYEENHRLWNRLCRRNLGLALFRNVEEQVRQLCDCHANGDMRQLSKHMMLTENALADVHSLMRSTQVSSFADSARARKLLAFGFACRMSAKICRAELSKYMHCWKSIVKDLKAEVRLEAIKKLEEDALASLMRMKLEAKEKLMAAMNKQHERKAGELNKHAFGVWVSTLSVMKEERLRKEEAKKRCIANVAATFGALTQVVFYGWRNVAVELKKNKGKKELATRNALRTIANSTVMLLKETFTAWQTDTTKTLAAKSVKSTTKAAVMRSIAESAGALLKACFSKWRELTGMTGPASRKAKARAMQAGARLAKAENTRLLAKIVTHWSVSAREAKPMRELELTQRRLAAATAEIHRLEVRLMRLEEARGAQLSMDSGHSWSLDQPEVLHGRALRTPRTLAPSTEGLPSARQAGGPLNVYVKVMHGQTVSGAASGDSVALQIDGTQYAADVKRKLVENGVYWPSTGSPEAADDADSRLLFRGVPLKHDVALKAQGVCDGCELRLLLMRSKLKPLRTNGGADSKAAALRGKGESAVSSDLGGFPKVTTAVPMQYAPYYQSPRTLPGLPSQRIPAGLTAMN